MIYAMLPHYILVTWFHAITLQGDTITDFALSICLNALQHGCEGETLNRKTKLSYFPKLNLNCIFKRTITLLKITIWALHINYRNAIILVTKYKYKII